MTIPLMRGDESKKALRELCEDLKLKNKTMVEVGVYAGESAEIFAQYCAQVYAIDPWLVGMSLADGAGSPEYLEMIPEVEQAFDERIKTIPNIKKIKAFDYEVISMFHDETLDFVYIDALHTEAEMLRQIDAWLPKIKPGGAIGGHDFCDYFSGIKKAVLAKLGQPDKVYSDIGNSWIKYKIKMPVHFIVTGEEFGYFYYLSVMSALKTQNASSVTIWAAKDIKNTFYLELLKNRVQLKKIDCPEFPALAGQPEHFIKAHMKDYLNYKNLYENGGLYLDLDTFCISDVTMLLGDKELVVPTDARKPEDFRYHYNGAILLGKRDSPLLAEALTTATTRLNRKPEDFPWGLTGPILISEVVFKHEKDIFIPEFRVCGGYAGDEIGQLYKEDLNINLDPKVRVIHLFAGVSNRLGGFFDNITPAFVGKSSSLIARTIRSVLSENEWNIKLSGEKMSEEWNTATKWESEWWAGCFNTFGEELKQTVYMKKMGFESFNNTGHTFAQKIEADKVLDIGGGPCSLLLKAVGFKKGTVIDPCSYPMWVHQRYKEAGIKYIVQKAEDMDITKRYDLVLIYNVLQHTENPEKIIKNALAVSKEVRIFEWLHVSKSIGHIHVLTTELLNEWLGGNGKEELLHESGCDGIAYYGIFKGARFNE